MKAALAALFALAVSALPAWAEPVPVEIGGDPEEPACAFIVEVEGKAADGTLLLPVREGPSPDAAQIDTLQTYDTVLSCSEIGDFAAIIYPASGQVLVNCGPMKPSGIRRRYDGPCRSGWVDARRLRIIGSPAG